MVTASQALPWSSACICTLDNPLMTCASLLSVQITEQLSQLHHLYIKKTCIIRRVHLWPRWLPLPCRACARTRYRSAAQNVSPVQAAKAAVLACCDEPCRPRSFFPASLASLALDLFMASFARNGAAAFQHALHHKRLAYVSLQHPAWQCRLMTAPWLTACTCPVVDVM